MKIITGDEWGRDLSSYRTAGSYQVIPQAWPADEAWVHHDVVLHGLNDLSITSDDDEIGHLKYLEATSVADANVGYRFPYSFVVFQSGNIYEGIYPFIGAHTEGRNSHSLAFMLPGNYHPPAGGVMYVTAAQVESIRWLVKYLRETGVLQAGLIYPTGGHRDILATACPGDNAEATIPAMRVPYELSISLPREEDMRTETFYPSQTKDYHEIIELGGGVEFDVKNGGLYLNLSAEQDSVGLVNLKREDGTESVAQIRVEGIKALGRKTLRLEKSVADVARIEVRRDGGGLITASLRGVDPTT